MTHAMLTAILEEAAAKTEKGESTLTEGRRLTLYASHSGVGLTVARVESLRLDDKTIRAKNDKGEVYVLSVEDVFAASVDRGNASSSGRKAGFVG